MVYEAGSFSLKDVGLNLTNSGDYGFKSVKKAIKTLKQSGIDVFISMGGWDYNCFGYAYTRYSVGGYGTSTPNYWKVDQYGSSNLDNCVEANEYCYTCEPPAAIGEKNNFAIFPEPSFSSTWQDAVAYVSASADSSTRPEWHSELLPGSPWTDSKTGKTVTVPGIGLYNVLKRDPYADFVQLASDLGASGVDVDYEEMWHADYFKIGAAGGPWSLHQTVYKYSAILKDVAINIEAINPKLMLSSATGAVSAWGGNWWGGNLKSVLVNASLWYPTLIDYVANSGGINVMTYDLSSNMQYFECPDESSCSLDQQVAFYMNTYDSSKIHAAVGYEVNIFK